MGSMIGDSKTKADKRLAELQQQWNDTARKVSDFIPETSSKEDYDKLIAAVNEAKSKNETIAQFRERVKKLGSSVVALAKNIGIG